MKVHMVIAKTVHFGYLKTGQVFTFVKPTAKYPDGIYIKTDISAPNRKEFTEYAVNIQTGKSIKMGFDKECIPLDITLKVNIAEGYTTPNEEWVEHELNVTGKDTDIPVVDVTTDEYLKWVYEMTIRRGSLRKNLARRAKYITEQDIINARNLVNFYTFVANVCDEQNGMIQDGEPHGGYYGGKIHFKLHDHYFVIRKGKSYTTVTWTDYDGTTPSHNVPILDWE